MRSVAHWRPSLDGAPDDRALGAEAHPGLGCRRAITKGGTGRW